MQYSCVQIHQFSTYFKCTSDVVLTKFQLTSTKFKQVTASVYQKVETPTIRRGGREGEEHRDEGWPAGTIDIAKC